MKNLLKENDLVECTLEERELIINVAIGLGIGIYGPTLRKEKLDIFKNLSYDDEVGLVGISEISPGFGWNILTPIQFIAKMVGVEDDATKAKKLSELEKRVEDFKKELNELANEK